MTARNVNEDRLVWIDLEMTGLDVEKDVIVEIACIVTDAELEQLDEGIQLVVFQNEATMAVMDDFVRNMHKKSGLLVEIPTSTTSVAAAEESVIEYIRSHVDTPGIAPLCGNSIGMDRRFLAHYMPNLDGYLHYRSVDVSSFKEMCRRWYPDIYRRRPGKSERHRALGDIRESIEELRFYKAELFPTRSNTSSSPAESSGS